MERSGFGNFALQSIILRILYLNEFTLMSSYPIIGEDLSIVAPLAELIGVYDPRLSSLMSDFLPIEKAIIIAVS